jgi:hypothetical protein
MKRHILIKFLVFLFLLPALAGESAKGSLVQGKTTKKFKAVVARYVKSQNQVNILLFDFPLKPNEVNFWKGIGNEKFPGRKYCAQFRIKFNAKNEIESYDATLECGTPEFFQRAGKDARKDFTLVKGTPGRGATMSFKSKGKGKETTWDWSANVEISEK